MWKCRWNIGTRRESGCKRGRGRKRERERGFIVRVCARKGRTEKRTGMKGNRVEQNGRGRRGREIEGPGVGPVGYVGAAPRPEAARHLGHPYIAKYSRVEKAPLYLQ